MTIEVRLFNNNAGSIGRIIIVFGQKKFVDGIKNYNTATAKDVG